MKKKTTAPTRATEFHLQTGSTPGKQDQSDQPVRQGEAQRLINDLRARQIELELENERLRRAAHGDQALVESQAMYRLLAENSSDTVSLIDRDGRVLYISPAYQRSLGYADNELLGIDTPAILNLIHPDDRSQIGAEIKRGRDLKLPTSRYEYRMQTKNGDYIWLEDLLRREFDENGQFIKTIVNSRDITRRKQAEQQLLSASAFLQAVQDSLSAHIAILDKNGVIVQVNAAWRRFGESNGLQTNAHCLGVNYLELCDSASGPNSEEASLTSRAIRDVLAGVQQEACIEYPCDGPDEKRWFMLKVTKFENEGDVWVVLAHENITERKWILESLSVSEARYRLLANNVPDIVYSLDGEGKIATVNSQAFERYGYTEQDSRGKPFLTFIHPEDREIVLQSFLNAMQEQRKFTHGLQFRIVAGDGASYWFELNSQARFDTAGRYLGEDGVLRDISERKRVEQALQKKETEYQTLVQNLMVGIVVHDPSTAILFSNAAASNLLGLTKEQLQGKSAMDPDWRFLRDDGTNMPLSEYPVNRVLSSGKEIYNFVAGISRRDKDKPVWVLCVAYPVYDMQDQLLQIVVTFSDITDRKQAEQDLRRSNDRYEQIVNTVPVMLYDYILRPDGVSDFLYVSPKMCREILELDSEAVLADMDLFWNMAHPQDISRLHQEDVMANLEGKLFYSEFRMIMPSGKMKWVSLNSKPRSVSPGEPAVWSGFLQDITERKEAEEALLKKMDELERFQRLTVGRELRMIELKKEVNHLLQQTGQQEKYRIVDEK